MDQLLTTINAYARLTKAAAIIYQSVHQQFMSPEQIGTAAGAPVRHGFVSRKSVAYFLDFPWQAQHPLPGQDSRYLLDAEGVCSRSPTKPESYECDCHDAIEVSAGYHLQPKADRSAH